METKQDVRTLFDKAEETLAAAMEARAAFAEMKANPLTMVGRKETLIKLYREVARTHEAMWLAQEAYLDADQSL
jgi:hypothetical protein